MNPKNEHQETEVKFYLSNRETYEKRVQQIGSTLFQPRTLEHNLRLDTPGMDLTKANKVLRLRIESENVLTFKGPSSFEDGVSCREEYEVTVSDLETTRLILKALGFETCVTYEKYRTKYLYENAEITIDETPIGIFSEIEAPTPADIRHIAGLLGLIWERRIVHSYLALFKEVKRSRKLDMKDLTFEAFKGLVIQPADMDTLPADELAYL
jgi:adenylate cyclase class 2